MDVGRKLQRLREGLKKSQQEIANVMEVSRQAINNIEAKANVETDTLSRYLAALGMTLPQFFESRVPAAFHDPKHLAYHEMLQEILEIDGNTAHGIRVNIEALYAYAVDEKRKKREHKHRTRDRTKMAGRSGPLA